MIANDLRPGPASLVADTAKVVSIPGYVLNLDREGAETIVAENEVQTSPASMP
jgi:hypothetical protein